MLKRGRGVEGCPLSYFHFSIEDEKWVSAPLRDSLSIIYGLEQQVQAGYDRGESFFPCGRVVMSIDALNDKIQKQQERLKQLKAQKLALEAKEKKRIAEQQRKEDTRKKILLGAYLLKKMEESEANRQRILADLDEYLIEPRDRALFGLSEGES